LRAPIPAGNLKLFEYRTELFALLPRLFEISIAFPQASLELVLKPDQLVDLLINAPESFTQEIAHMGTRSGTSTAQDQEFSNGCVPNSVEK
jgi:hypothetical protein